MTENESCGSLMPEDTYDNHFSVVNKSKIHEYKLATQSASNASSIVLLNHVWQQNKQLFTDNCSAIIKSVKTITQNADTTNSATWKSSLRNFEDPLSLIEDTQAKCINGCFNSTSFGLDQFHGECSCNLNETDRNQESQHDKRGLSYFVKTLNSGSSNDEAKSSETQRQIFKPKFGRPKPHIKNTPQTFPSSTKHSYQDIDITREELSRGDNNKKVTSKYTPIYQDVDLDKEDEMKMHKSNVAKITFKSAKEQLLASNPAAKRTLGATRKAQSKFVSPMIGVQDKPENIEPDITDERLKHIDPKMIELIESEIMDKGNPIGWDDIAGLQMAKSVIQEAVVWPLLRPDIFTGLRRPPKGILLFGPPGTGKTLIGKCVAAQCHATFFSISASSLTSKWIGDGEKMVRALFAVARCHQPAVIFIDEIDSLLTQRNDTEHEATRRIKTEFLVQLDGAATGDEDRLLIVGATNRPQELDEAARRRLVKRLYIPLPEADAREQIIMNLLKSEANDLSQQNVAEIAALTDGYSGADMKSLCSEAAMGPIRAVPLAQIVSIQRDKVRPVNVQDFKNALQRVRPSVSQDDLGQYVKWNQTYGQGFT